MKQDLSQAIILTAVESLSEQIETDIKNKFAKEFFQRVYATSLNSYSARLCSIGFEKMCKVLDAGCGFGQWSLALANLNEHVSSCDISAERVNIFQRLIDAVNANNIETNVCTLEKLPYDDACFDGIFCYGVIFCTDWKKSLREFYRVLKPGGYLYLSANAVGYQLYLWHEEPHKSADYDPRELAALAFSNTIDYEKYNIPPKKGQLIIEKIVMQQQMQSLGLKIINCDAEGHIAVAKSLEPPVPFFKGSYAGLDCCYEVLSQK